MEKMLPNPLQVEKMLPNQIQVCKVSGYLVLVRENGKSFSILTTFANFPLITNVLIYFKVWLMFCLI